MQTNQTLPNGDLVVPDNYKYIECYLTLRCQLACGFCINVINEDDDHKRRNSEGIRNNDVFKDKRFGELSAEEWIAAINRIKTRPGVPVTLGGGEPFVHPGFIEIVNGINRDKEIDILTNLRWGQRGLERFANEVDPARLRRDAPYASIRVSYHPNEPGMEPLSIAKDVKYLQERGFSIGVWSVLFPSPAQLTAINQFQFIAKEQGIDFRLKEFVGIYEGKDDLNKPFAITYGDYSKYPGAAFSRSGFKYADCKTTELLVGPSGKVYRCHTDLYDGKRDVGSLLDIDFKIEDKFRPCSIYGRCNPCDVKVKTDHRQQIGHTSVEIKNVGQA